MQGHISTSMARLLRGEPVEISDDGSAVRDYLCVEDLALAAVLGIETCSVAAIHIGSGAVRSLSQVIEMPSAVSGTTVQVDYHRGKAFDVPHLVLSIVHAREALGWAPSTPFEDGVAAKWLWLGSIRE